MEMINIFTFQDFKNRYDIMSVPAIIVDDQHIYFGENIKILEPESLKQKLKTFYKKALESYEKN